MPPAPPAAPAAPAPPEAGDGRGATSPNEPHPPLPYPPPFLTPVVDDCAYRLVSLDNGIQCLLCHDPTADKAAAACDVRVGSLSDYPDVPGIAHFLEHMLFYSSSKYPQEDEYSKFIAEKGGKTNAYTSNESTQYHFDVAWNALPEALDRFSQFFICPLISEDGVSREANAVDSEHSKNINADPWKKLQLWRSTAHPAHPMNRFSTGNLATLITDPESRGQSPHALVKKFYDTHYSASLMKVAIVGRQSLDELETLVRTHFSAVLNKPEIQKPEEFSPDAVTEKEQGILLKVVPERDGHSIELQFATLSEQAHATAAPCHYVSHLLGHEGEGSAFALLKKLGLATSLVAGEASTSFSTRSFFMVRIELTEEGNRTVDQVVNIVFRYIDKLKAPGGVCLPVFEEMQALSRLKFEYRDTMDPYQYVSSLAHGMQVYPLDSLLLCMYNVPLRYDEALIRSVVDDLTPEKARVMWSSKTLESACVLAEPWYGTKYSIERIPEKWVQLWVGGAVANNVELKIEEGALHLPKPNEYIPTDFTLVPLRHPHPNVTYSSPFSRLWWRPEPGFKTPKAAVYLHLIMPEAYTSPTAAVLTQLFCKLVNDSLSELSYPADLAGLYYGVRPTMQGVLISLSGYHHRLPRLSMEVVSAVLLSSSTSDVYNTSDAVIKEDRFEVAKEKLKKEYANMKFEQPYQVALYELAMAVEAKRWHVKDYEEVLGRVACDDVRRFVGDRLLTCCRVEAYVGGNLPKDVSEKLVQDVESSMVGGTKGSSPNKRTTKATRPPSPSQWTADIRVVKLPAGHPVLLPRPAPNPSNENSAVVVAFQIGPDDLHNNALGELIAHIGKRPAFYQLRTVEQLGYLTFFSTYHTSTIRNLAFIVQSSSFSPWHVSARVEAFLPHLRSALAALTPQEFEAQVEELAKSKLEKPKRLREVAARDWREIDDGTLRFGRREAEVEALRGVTHEEVVAFYDCFVLDPTKRKKVTVHVVSSLHQQQQEDEEEEKEKEQQEQQEEEVVSEDNVWGWKQCQELYPVSLSTSSYITSTTSTPGL